MLSKGGKIEYSCPFCYSKRIERVRVHPTFAAILRKGESWSDKEWNQGISMTRDHGECPNCNSWFLWSTRIKKSLKREKHV